MAGRGAGRWRGSFSSMPDNVATSECEVDSNFASTVLTETGIKTFN